ncbi:MAG TPA: nucleotide exchange factor GrpE [Caldithrix abyssi]|uniref:Protein GrpE n=1 Tax=Caldithrix abyssi TaxID=187145 RepID=A0A7V5RN47_CALAY|nr:nucleotide exchange factor GrpE [Caldithrix abyssi]
MTDIKISDKKTGKKNVSKTKENKEVKELKSKIENLEEELEKLRGEAESYKEQLLRKAAEFDNYKRRTEREFLDNIQNASQELILELLPVVDDLERSIEHAREEETDTPMLQGVELVYKNLMSLLEKRGLKPIKSVGEEFDPDKHNALMQVDTDKVESGYVADEHVKGYMLNDKVLRHAQVLVAK